MSQVQKAVDVTTRTKERCASGAGSPCYSFCGHERKGLTKPNTAGVRRELAVFFGFCCKHELFPPNSGEGFGKLFIKERNWTALYLDDLKAVAEFEGLILKKRIF